MWRARRWRELLNVLDHLPRTSAYAQAMATDEELAAEVARLPEANRTAVWSRSQRDYTAEVEMLSAVFDRIGELIRVTAATRGARGRPPQQAPRPVNAVDRERRRLAQVKHQKLADRLLRRPGR